MKEARSDVIEVRLVSGHNGLEVLQNQKTLSFTEQSWMDLHGEIHLSAYDEVTDFYYTWSNFMKYIPFFYFYLTESMNSDTDLWHCDFLLVVKPLDLWLTRECKDKVKKTKNSNRIWD